MNVKYGVAPLFVAAQGGYEQIVQLLLEKGKANVDLPNKVILFILFFFFFFFQFLIFLFFNVKDGETPLFVAAQNGHEQIVQILLEKGKPNVDLSNKVILFILFFFFFFFFFFFQFLTFSFSFFYFFFNVKYGGTPLWIAAWEGHKKTVQLLLEKGKPNVDLATKVLLLIVFFFFFFFSFSFFYFFSM